MKQCFSCELIYNVSINNEIARLDFEWPGSMTKAGQFFMVKLKRSGVFLPRPISFIFWKDDSIGFLIQCKGRGTEELANLQIGEKAELIGPLGNAWADFLPAVSGSKTRGLKPVALIGGGVGIAPLLALSCELPKGSFDFYAGFRTGFRSQEEKNLLLGPSLSGLKQLIITAEEITDVSSDFNENIRLGRIPDFLNPSDYSAISACGPEPMLRVVAEKCAAAEVPCYVSLERHMACGVGACLGCTVATTEGNRRCCTDGPIFPAEEVFF